MDQFGGIHCPGPEAPDKLICNDCGNWFDKPQPQLLAKGKVRGVPIFLKTRTPKIACPECGSKNFRDPKKIEITFDKQEEK